MNKLHNKDFSIAFKTGTDQAKFAKEATKGELFFNTSDSKLYIANTSAGVSDAVLFNTNALNGPGFNISIRNTESYILSNTPTNPSGQVTIAFGTDTYELYIWDGSAWSIYNND